MRKRSVQISLVIAVIILAAIVYLMVSTNGQESNKQSMDSSSSAEPVAQQDAQPNAEMPVSQKAGVYTDYSNTALANASGTTLLFFHASWCPQCRALESDIKKSGVPENTTILKVDYDSNQQLRQKYGVTIQTTVVKVDNQGNSLGKYVAYDNPSLQSVLDNLR